MRFTGSASCSLYRCSSSFGNCTDLGRNTLIIPPPAGSCKTHATAVPNFVSTLFMDCTRYSMSFVSSPIERFNTFVCRWSEFKTSIVNFLIRRRACVESGDVAVLIWLNDDEFRIYSYGDVVIFIF
eukprot:XP_016662526.1 PREDICTED: uncharacterized protein LOC107884592 [Acyrthosiphon pisum]